MTEAISASAGVPTIGILMLDTRFPRFPGDVCNEHTWPFGVRFKRVDGAYAKAVVENTSTDNLQPFINAAQELERHGVAGITTSCGFLILAQHKISSELNVPFVASSLMQIPWVASTLPQKQRVGILTIDSTAITPKHLLAAGAAADTPVSGTEGGKEFTRAILEDRPSMSFKLCETDNILAAQQLVKQHPDVGAIVLECTNMAPYADAISRATRRPVFSIVTLVNWFHAGLAPGSFPNTQGSKLEYRSTH